MSCAVLHHAPKMFAFLQMPYVLAYVQIEGANILFPHSLPNNGDMSQIQHGLSVQVVYDEGPVDHPILLMAFEV